MVTCRAGGRCSASLLPLRRLCSHFLDVRLVDRQQNVLRFDVRVDDLALGVKVVKTLQDLHAGESGGE